MQNRRSKHLSEHERIRRLPRHSAGLDYTLAIETDATDPYHVGTEQDGRWNHVQECLLLLVSAGDTVLDIGANIGVVTIPLAAKGAQVIAYEVLAENVRFLNAAIRDNKFEDRVTVRNLAAWEENTRLSFTGESAWGRVVPGHQPTHDAVAIDSDIHPSTQVSAVKLDVEGSELHVLRGMRRLIETQHPHIVFESNSLELGRLGSSAAAMFDYLRQFGYRIYRVYDRRRLLRPGIYPQESSVSDFLATVLDPWQLRWKVGFRVGALRPRHIVRKIFDWDDDCWPDRLHLLAVIDRLPAQVRRDEAIAGMVNDWRNRYGDHPLLQTVRDGVFGSDADRGASEPEKSSVSI